MLLSTIELDAAEPNGPGAGVLSVPVPPGLYLHILINQTIFYINQSNDLVSQNSTLPNPMDLVLVFCQSRFRGLCLHILINQSNALVFRTQRCPTRWTWCWCSVSPFSPWTTSYTPSPSSSSSSAPWRGFATWGYASAGSSSTRSGEMLIYGVHCAGRIRGSDKRRIILFGLLNMRPETCNYWKRLMLSLLE